MKKLIGRKTKASLLISLIIGLILVTSLFTASCSCSCDIRIGYVGISVGNQLSATYHLFSGTRDATIDVEAGKTLVIEYKSTVESGGLTIQLYDSDHHLVYEFPTGSEGVKEVTAARDEKYKLEVHGNDAKGSFELHWHTV